MSFFKPIKRSLSDRKAKKQQQQQQAIRKEAEKSQFRPIQEEKGKEEVKRREGWPPPKPERTFRPIVMFTDGGQCYSTSHIPREWRQLGIELWSIEYVPCRGGASGGPGGQRTPVSNL
ncbi:uncharacterized protein LOC117119383 [Anneissia japonica]|uniref:uncharacterized protein LOC117119383 n=1 Tax=Anneissia japonica TaxID=1529436 RepID=UPI0014259D52|nr:uncharacterized protein LOC117119383 [Anneissia japonica]